MEKQPKTKVGQNRKKQGALNIKPFKIPTLGHHREKEFKMYVIWRTIPKMFFRSDPKKFEMLGLDEDISYLYSIKNQTEFCRKYELNKNTITKWNKEIEEKNLLEPECRKFVKGLMSNAIGALYFGALKHGDAARFVALAKYAGEWPTNEKSSSTNTNENLDNINHALVKFLDSHPKKEINETPPGDLLLDELKNRIEKVENKFRNQNKKF